MSSRSFVRTVQIQRTSTTQDRRLSDEKLSDEAHRNGNMNWDEGHVILAEYLRDTLVGSGLFGEETVDSDSTAQVRNTRTVAPRSLRLGHGRVRLHGED
jgi:hypothetical protein